MSDEPLTPTVPVCIILCNSITRVDERLVQYGLSGTTDPRIAIHVVATPEQIAALVLASDTPWAFFQPFTTEPWHHMKARFGYPVTLDKALKMHNNEFAVRPEQLRG